MDGVNSTGREHSAGRLNFSALGLIVAIISWSKFSGQLKE